jgi:hypothetical protein
MKKSSRTYSRTAERFNLLCRIAAHPPTRADFVEFSRWERKETEGFWSGLFDRQLKELKLPPRRIKTGQSRRENFVRLMLRARLITCDAENILRVTIYGHVWTQRIYIDRMQQTDATRPSMSAFLSFGA